MAAGHAEAVWGHGPRHDNGTVRPQHHSGPGEPARFSRTPPTPASSLSWRVSELKPCLGSPRRILQDSVPTVPGIHKDPSVQGQPAAAAGPGEGEPHVVLPDPAPLTYGSHGPGAAAGRALLPCLRRPRLGTVCPAASVVELGWGAVRCGRPHAGPVQAPQLS